MLVTVCAVYGNVDLNFDNFKENHDSSLCCMLPVVIDVSEIDFSSTVSFPLHDALFDVLTCSHCGSTLQ